MFVLWSSVLKVVCLCYSLKSGNIKVTVLKILDFYWSAITLFNTDSVCEQIQKHLCNQ